MKPFNLEEAKAGNPVCLSSGEPVRLLGFDLASDYPNFGVVQTNGGQEYVSQWDNKGVSELSELADLMMATVVHTKIAGDLMDGSLGD